MPNKKQVKTFEIGKIINGALTIALYIFVLIPYIKAMIGPVKNLEFIYGYPVIIFLFEALTFHAKAFILMSPREVSWKLFTIGSVLFIYLPLGILFTYLLNNIYPVLTILLIVSRRIFGKEKVKKMSENVVINGFRIMGLWAVSFIPAQIVAWEVIDPYLMRNSNIPAPADLFGFTAPVFWCWGIIYFSRLIISEIKEFNEKSEKVEV